MSGGLIKREDIDAVRERTRIEDVVGAQVRLQRAGVGTLKGLCPFHDERTPSFNVRPSVGRYHCFGCGESGDAISFVMKIDGLTFTEAVEYLAGKCGVQLRYEDSKGDGARGPGDYAKRQRLLDANKQAAEFYAQQLFASPEAIVGRKFLADRAFVKADAETFGVGYAPKGWSHLSDYLTARGFTAHELLAAGLVKQGQRGVYDAFRGRLIWPIKDTAGAVVGFGARRLYEDDGGPKFLNTTETQLYKKSQVFYGIDLAKKSIFTNKRVVIVEGYTDVMAAHLSGVDCAVATCGTSFTTEHVRLIRRLMGDSTAGMQLSSGEHLGGEIIYVFDGDAAGQKAAIKAFREDQRFLAQTFVAVAGEGMDPCDLRLAQGPAAVRALVDSRVPLVEFVIKTALARYDLATVEGRVGALRETAGYVASIRDQVLREGYARTLAGWIGLDNPADVSREVERASRRAAGQPVAEASPSAAASSPAGRGLQLPDERNPVAHTEMLALAAVVQYPAHVPEAFDALGADAFTAGPFPMLHAAIRAAGGVTHGRTLSAQAWVTAIENQTDAALVPLVGQLAVTVLPEDREEAIERFVGGLIRTLTERLLTRQIAETRGALQRMDAAINPDPEAQNAALARVVALEKARRDLVESAS